MGRKKILEFYDKNKIQKIIKIIKRSRVYKSISLSEYVKRHGEYIKLDKKVTNFFEIYVNYTTDLYFNYLNEKHNYSDKTCKKLLNYNCIFYDPNCQVCTMKDEFYQDIKSQTNVYIYDVLRFVDYNEQCKNHVKLNLLKQTKIPNEVIEKLIKLFL